MSFSTVIINPIIMIIMFAGCACEHQRGIHGESTLNDTCDDRLCGQCVIVRCTHIAHVQWQYRMQFGWIYNTDQYLVSHVLSACGRCMWGWHVWQSAWQFNIRVYRTEIVGACVGHDQLNPEYTNHAIWISLTWAADWPLDFPSGVYDLKIQVVLFSNIIIIWQYSSWHHQFQVEAHHIVDKTIKSRMLHNRLIKSTIIFAQILFCRFRAGNVDVKYAQCNMVLTILRQNI